MARRANLRQVRPQVTKQRKHETLEDRVVMSADPLLGGSLASLHSVPIDDTPVLTTHQQPTLSLPVMDGLAEQPDFWIDPEVSAELQLDELDRLVDTMLREGHQLTGQDDVVSKYGFTGAGQTVAVIDTGIAYNHYALGGGMGAGYRVVGGWDFAEGDADFNDDAGSSSAGHGTHVAGIVGANSDDPHQGVATGVDLVGLRVFDDAGAGYFSWIEQALQWVHTNKDSFNNPITAVNLSLGTTWNSDDNPGWANLEEEFAQLEADGIFISVSAGNSYEDFNANGVSYPASSDHVIPVMATKNDGSLAYFSQRATYAIGAPGWAITSTVPDHSANDADSLDDDWAQKYGTSMAAPYLAGASVLVREAMEFGGQTGIDQWDIYNHMMSTADSFYDSTSQTNFKRLNLEAAIDALMPVDDHGTSVATAHNFGTLGEGSTSVSGVVSTLDDNDYFTFTAGVTGVATFAAANASHDLTASWDAWGGTWSEADGGCQMDVVAGQTYTVALSSSTGLGYYDLQVGIESTFSPEVWGAIGTQETRSWQPSGDEQWFSVTAGRAGYFTAETLTSSGTANVAIYDAQQNLLAAAGTRADFVATAGQNLLLRVTGDAASYDVRMTNALSVGDGVASLVGTSGVDSFGFTAGTAQHTVSLNGVAYTIDAATTSGISLDGAGGDDAVVIDALEGVNETVTMRAGWAQIASASYQSTMQAIENVTVNGQSADLAYLFDTAGDDSFVGAHNTSTLTSSGGSNTAAGFGRVFAFANAGGNDTAHFDDGATDDQFVATPSYALMRALTGEFYNYTTGFDSVTAASTSGGADVAQLYDGTGADSLLARADYSQLSADDGSFSNRATGFARVLAFATAGGDDMAAFYDGAGNEVFVAAASYAVMSTADQSFNNYASGFEMVQGYATGGGTDTANLYDGAGDDVLYATPGMGRMTGGSGAFDNLASGFERLNAFALNGGSDVATLYDGASNDQFVGTPDYAYLRGMGGEFYNFTFGFGEVRAVSSVGGIDTAYFYDSAGDDTFSGGRTVSYLQSANQLNHATGFGNTFAYALNGGNDHAVLSDTDGNDTLFGRSDFAYHFSAGAYRYARGFDSVAANSLSGDDTADIDAIDYALSQTGAWA